MAFVNHQEITPVMVDQCLFKTASGTREKVEDCHSKICYTSIDYDPEAK